MTLRDFSGMRLRFLTVHSNISHAHFCMESLNSLLLLYQPLASRLYTTSKVGLQGSSLPILHLLMNFKTLECLHDLCHLFLVCCHLCSVNLGLSCGPKSVAGFQPVTQFGDRTIEFSA